MIHVSENMLKRAKFSVKKYQGKLNISGYSRRELEEKVCKNCLVRSFKKNDVIVIEDIEENSCSCSQMLSPIMSIKVDAGKNKIITIV